MGLPEAREHLLERTKDGEYQEALSFGSVSAAEEEGRDLHANPKMHVNDFMEPPEPPGGDEPEHMDLGATRPGVKKKLGPTETFE